MMNDILVNQMHCLGAIWLIEFWKIEEKRK
jgi:hypothetical protein